MRFWVLLRLFESASDINDISPFPTSSKLASIIFTHRSFLVLLVYDLFQSTWPVLARIATPDGSDSDLLNEVYDIINCVAIYYEKCVSGNSLIRKGKLWTQISRKVKTLKALKETVKCVYGPSFEYGNEQYFSFTDTWTTENKTINRLQKETL